MGDGLLAEFASVVDAVECAVALAAGHWPSAMRRFPRSERIEVRIGINLGEVIVEGDDRYGEGVNIAARLEQLAEPGGICVSGKVAKEVEKKLAFGFEPMGEQKVKNIDEPIAVYRVRLDDKQGLTPSRLQDQLASHRVGSHRHDCRGHSRCSRCHTGRRQLDPPKWATSLRQAQHCRAALQQLEQRSEVAANG